MRRKKRCLFTAGLNPQTRISNNQLAGMYLKHLSRTLFRSPILFPAPLVCLSTISGSYRRFSVSATIEPSSSSSSPSLISQNVTTTCWKPMCLYYTQGKCTKVDDLLHIEKFNHNCSADLHVNAAALENMCSQEFDFFLVLDLEGKVEILEFPVLIVDARTMGVVDFFHRFVRPTAMSEQRIGEYIEGKYGKFGVDRVWHDTALPFEEVIQQFEAWLEQHQLWKKEQSGLLCRSAFVTCGNWDLKTKVPQQCKVSKMKLPPYFMEWINLKDVYLNFYHREARGMMSMLKQLDMKAFGNHHLGFDDTKNITRVLQHMLADGALMKITARRDSRSLDRVQFTFANRI